MPESSDLMLQIDIEGGEYPSIMNRSDPLIQRFRIIIIEFHFLHYLWDKQFFDIIEKTFEKILQAHICVHIHPNNYAQIDTRLGVQIPEAAEFTFLRKDRATSTQDVTHFPHELDTDHAEHDKPLVLPPNWYHPNTPHKPFSHSMVKRCW